MSEHKAIRRLDYKPPGHRVDRVDLRIELDARATLVRARMNISPNHAGPAPSLELDGGPQVLESIVLDGRSLGKGDYVLRSDGLTIHHPPEVPFVLEITNRIDPESNTALSGLYISSGTFCTQCEAEGFRNIVYFPDRPDVLAIYTVTLVADESRYPVLLSNGNRIAHGSEPGGRHWATWHDPFPKPSYLFAAVAGTLAEVRDHFTTRSGNSVQLSIWVEPGDESRCDYAMDALKRAMKWDEDVFGLEYDLDVFNIVAVSDFNFGAMENKSLNIFNAKYVLASAQTATDADYASIESIVAHEYFHNWTGNRVTCRDWFQLSLKEGLTVFRDQEFSADQRGRPLRRISDMRNLRARQFPEDAGPLAHPVRPESYVEISNFYTATIYDKGAEVIRMMAQVLGHEGFIKGHKTYIDRHDGTAAAIEDFVAAMADASGQDIDAFWHWYNQAGTPLVKADWNYDSSNKRFSLTLQQSTPPTPGQPVKSSKPVPVRVGLIGRNGLALPNTDQTLILTRDAQTFVFDDIAEEPVISLNRGYSAPIRLQAGYSTDQLLFLMAHDDDPCARYEAGQQAGLSLILDQVDGQNEISQSDFIAAIEQIITDPNLDPAYIAEAVTLPGERFVADQMTIARPVEIARVRERLRAHIGVSLSSRWQEIYGRLSSNEPFSPDASSAGRRALRNTALGYLAAGGTAEAIALATHHYNAADNMTDRLAGLGCLSRIDTPERLTALDDFLERYRDDTLVVDKWFSIQATSSLENTLDQVIALTGHRLFTPRNPNKVRSLIGAFASGNPARFHEESGRGYTFLCDWIIALDAINPQTAARMIEPLTQWRRVDPIRGQKMRGELERILARPSLSKDSFEIASKAL